jgi:cytochrome c biogenesis protein CcmG/thiol:disulfide interchange protein DsbE
LPIRLALVCELDNGDDRYLLIAGDDMCIVQRYIRFILVCALIASVSACSPLSARRVSPSLGMAAPDFTLPKLDGGTVQLAGQRGRVVIVNFWASWCGPCVNETPRLVAWYQQHHDSGLVVLGVDSLYLDSRASVADFVHKSKVSYPILLDGEGDVSKQWRAQQLPRSYVVDRSGVIRFMRIGELTNDDLTAQVLPLLGKHG